MKENLAGYGAPENSLGTRPARKGVVEVSGNTYFLLVIFMMILLFFVISLGPLIFF